MTASYAFQTDFLSKSGKRRFGLIDFLGVNYILRFERLGSEASVIVGFEQEKDKS